MQHCIVYNSMISFPFTTYTIEVPQKNGHHRGFSKKGWVNLGLNETPRH